MKSLDTDTRPEAEPATDTIKNNPKDEFRRASSNLLLVSRYNSARINKARKKSRRMKSSRESVFGQAPDYSVIEMSEAQSLTKREQQVADLVAQGLANKTVAGQLGLCEGTVKLHLHSIYRKLRVSNRAGLILTAMTNVQK